MNHSSASSGPKIFYLDNDGYLGRHGHPWDPESVQGLEIANTFSERPFCIITGRPNKYALNRCEEAGIYPFSVSGELGGVTQLDDGKIIRYDGSREEMKRMRGSIEDLFDGDHIIIPVNGENMRIPCCIEPGKDIITTISMDPVYNRAIEEMSQEEIDGSLDIIQNSIHGMLVRKGLTDKIYTVRNVDSYEIVPVGLDKSYPMDILSKITGIPHHDAFAGGDGIPDIVMMRNAGYSGTTGNAKSLVKRAVFEEGGEVSPESHGKGFLSLVKSAYMIDC